MSRIKNVRIAQVSLLAFLIGAFTLNCGNGDENQHYNGDYGGYGGSYVNSQSSGGSVPYSSSGTGGTASVTKYMSPLIFTYSDSVCRNRYCPSSHDNDCTWSCTQSNGEEVWPACGRVYCNTDADCMSGFVCMSGIIGLTSGKKNCLPKECQNCNDSCMWEGTACAFDACSWPKSGTSGTGGSTKTGGNTGTGGKTSTPAATCKKYSSPGCSTFSANTFGSICIEAGCHFNLGSCVSHGDFSDSTCECACY